MNATKTSEVIKYDRRHFLGIAAMSIAAAEFIMPDSLNAQSSDAKLADSPSIKPGANTSFGPMRQIDAGVLNVGYAEAGPAAGPPVILLHGWPYDKAKPYRARAVKEPRAVLAEFCTEMVGLPSRPSACRAEASQRRRIRSGTFP